MGQIHNPEGRNGMKPHPFFGFLFLLGSLCACAPHQDNPAVDIKTLLPKSGEAGPWRPAGEVEEYAGDDLYIYIDGGAEIFHEYGFVRVVLQDYEGPGEKSLSLEIYQMKEPAGAFGMYSFKTSNAGEALDHGQEGRLEGYYANFWKGPYIATLTGFDESPETVQGILAVGRAAAGKISLTGREPEVLGLLPGPGLMEGGRKYVRGQLGLFNLYPFSPRNIFGIHEAVMGRYEGGYDLFIFPYADQEEAASRFSEGGSLLAREPRYIRVEQEEATIRARDDRGTYLTFRLIGSRIVTALSDRSFLETDRAVEEAAPFLQR
jgi:hypothetical protein